MPAYTESTTQKNDTAFNIAGIGCFAAVAYVALNLMDSSDDEEGSISYLFYIRPTKRTENCGF
jgi:hypothetical protein